MNNTRNRPAEILITASEAYPRLEELFLAAQSEIRMGFRIFDPRTRLRSKAAREVGETWGDLFVHTINRGVKIDISWSDFDPVMAFDMHQQAWQFVSIACGLNEIAAPGAAPLCARAILHPAKGGIFPKLMFAPKTRSALQESLDRLNAAPDPETQLRHAPGLKGLVRAVNGRFAMRKFVLPDLYPVTLHHKLAVIDQSVTYIGGLDLNERRFDDGRHDQPAQETWHDVQMVVHDRDVAADADQFLRQLPDVIAGQTSPPHHRSDLRVTLSKIRRRNAVFLRPCPMRADILREHLAQISKARSMIYLETQYFRDRRIAKALAQAGKRHPKLKLVLVLPAAPEDVAFGDQSGLDARFGAYLQQRALRRVRRVFGDRFLAVSPVQPRPTEARDSGADQASLLRAPIIYVHAKVSLFDDRAAIVSSANLNGRSMSWDAEAGVILQQREDVKALARRLFDHWLGDAMCAAATDPDRAFAVWRDVVTTNARTHPAARKGFMVPYDMTPGAELAVPLPGAPEEMV